MSDRRATHPALTREGILADEAERRAERERLMKRRSPRYGGPTADPDPSYFRDILADRRTDWDAIEKEIDCPDV